MSLVLVADDEPAVLEVLTEVVEDLGHEVVRAHDGREALQLARAQRPNLVVTDHMMPRLSGLELCRALREEEHLREVPVILLSAALPPEATEAFAYLAKPFELDEFEALVKRTLSGSSVPVVPSSIPRRPPRPPPVVPAEALFHWVAHALKTPIAAAKMNLQLIERRTHKDGAAPDHAQFETVTRQLENMEWIVGALLDSSALAEGRLTLTRARGDLREAVEDTVTRWRELHPDFEVALQMPAAPVMVDLDAPRFAQILGSLLSNAQVHASPPRQARVEVTVTDGRAELDVQDFGPGISSTAQRTLFNGLRPDGATGERRTGLGLYLASELAALHGGALNVKSALGQGTTFTVLLPLSA